MLSVHWSTPGVTSFESRTILPRWRPRYKADPTCRVLFRRHLVLLDVALQHLHRRDVTTRIPAGKAPVILQLLPNSGTLQHASHLHWTRRHHPTSQRIPFGVASIRKYSSVPELITHCVAVHLISSYSGFVSTPSTCIRMVPRIRWYMEFRSSLSPLSNQSISANWSLANCSSSVRTCSLLHANISVSTILRLCPRVSLLPWRSLIMTQRPSVFFPMQSSHTLSPLRKFIYECALETEQWKCSEPI